LGLTFLSIDSIAPGALWKAPTDQRKQAKLQWIDDPSKINGDNLNDTGRETSRPFRNKKREYMEEKIDEL
jgi:hypothetical protein